MSIQDVILTIGLSLAFLYLMVGFLHISKNLFPYAWRNDLNGGIKMLIKDLDRAKYEVNILSRSCTPACYNNKDVANAFENASGRGVRITIITSAPLSKDSELVRLAEEKIIKLYHHPSIQYHLRDVDGKWIFTQTDTVPTKRSFLRAKNPPIGISTIVRAKLQEFLEKSKPFKAK